MQFNYSGLKKGSIQFSFAVVKQAMVVK